AAQGMRFTDAHSPSAVCTPTRYGLLTGRYCWRTSLKQGVLQGYDPLLIEQDRLTAASLLRKHGYATHGVGKWHLGLGPVKPTDYTRPLRPGPRSVGFESFFGIPASLDFDPYLFVRDEAAVAKPTEKIAGSNGRRGQKSDAWEGGHRIPFLARWPGKIKPGSISDELICLSDLVATLAELTGEKLPKDAAEDSESLLGVLLGKKPAWPIHEAVV